VTTTTGYLHGYRAEERERLHRQAQFLAPSVHDGLPYQRRTKLLEIGCGVGAQTEILLRRWPELHVTAIDVNDEQLAEARRFLGTVPWAAGRYALAKGDATKLEHPAATFDAAFLCWVLEHVGDPARVLDEVRRVLVPGSPVVCSEVLNATLFVHPGSPHTGTFWAALNEEQLAMGGDPFVGAKLGNLLMAVGFHDVVTEVKSFHLDNRDREERAAFLGYWSELLLSSAPALLAAKKVDERVVLGMREELARVAHDPEGAFFYAFIQARARA
jgi:SAM-dependent methyltransferase